MSTITTAQAGPWNDTATWTGGAIPTASDDAELSHHVTISADIFAHDIIIKAGGGLSVDPACPFTTTITAHFSTMTMERVLNDDRTVRLDGIRLDPDTVVPSISSIGSYEGDGFPTTASLIEETGRVFIEDPGFFASSAGLRDTRPEGCAPAYTEKATNMVRYINIPVQIAQEDVRLLGQLYRMAQGPHQVLAVTHSCILKGFIESVSPQNVPGANFIRVQVSVAEGAGV